MREGLEAIIRTPVYQVAMLFLFLYPVATSLIWMAGALTFRYLDRDPAHKALATEDELVPVTVMIPAHNEASVIAATLASVRLLDWPDLEIIVIDDGSTDATVAAITPHLEDPRIRLVVKKPNEGKAMALDDALPLVRSELVLILDADGRPAPDVLRLMVPHLLREPNIAAVTGNPRVENTPNVLTKLQAIEFSATVSVLRRAQAVWGSLCTFSGICTLLRKSNMQQVGRFRPEMATEDISLAWQLQGAGYGVTFEPRALFSMQVPETLSSWWSQRKRWALGLGQVLRRNVKIFRRRESLALAPIWIEASVSVLWSYLLVVSTVFWAACIAFGVWGGGNSPIPRFWGIVAGMLCIAQILVGVSMDSSYDPKIRKMLWWAPLYPLVYWWLGALVSFRGTIPGLLKKPAGTVTWNIERIDD